MEATLKNIHIGGLDFRVYDTEEGSPVLVFLHYWGGSSQTWRPVWSELADHFRCVAIDLRGWGESSKTSDDYSLVSMAKDVEGIIDSLELTNYCLIGHSMGGKIAQIIARTRPVGLQHLILVAPAPPTPMNVSPRQRELMLKSYESREGVEGALAVLTEKNLNDHLREQIITDTLKGAPDAKRAWTFSEMLLDISDTISSISAPTVVVVGDCDRVEKEEVLRSEIGGRLADCSFVVLPGVGHLSPLEAPAELAAVISQVVHRV